MKRVVTFGELMLRLSPEAHLRTGEAARYDAYYGGCEANTALMLASLGVNSRYVTKLPDNALGEGAIRHLRRYGVETNRILRGGERMGLYFLERGTSVRPSRVLYDRAYSAIATAAAEEFNWAELLEGADWFHFSGITLALSGALRNACLSACSAAKAMHIPVSCDLNYRKNLWDSDVAGRAIEPFLPYMDVCITNDGQIGALFGLTEPDIDENRVEKCCKLAHRMKECYSIRSLALTMRTTHSASRTGWQALWCGSDGKIEISRAYELEVTDRVGAGDAFDAGLIYGLVSNWAPKQALEIAAAAGALKHTIEGDAAPFALAELSQLIEGSDGRVNR